MRRHVLLVIALVLVATAFAAPVQAQVIINEFNTGTPDFVELWNQGTQPVDVSGWRLETYYATSAVTPTQEAGFTMPANTIIAAGDYLVLQEMGTAGLPGTLPKSLYVGYNFFWVNARTTELALYDAAYLGVDYVYFDYYGGPKAPHLPPNQTWIGDFNTGTGDELYRPGIVDTDNASDWIKTGVSYSLGSPGLANPGQCQGYFLQYGTACVGSLGTPLLIGSGCPVAGNSVTITIDLVLSGAPALMLLGTGNQVANVTPNCQLQILPNVPPVISFIMPGAIMAIPATLPATTPSNVDVFLQVLFADSANIFGVASTNPLQIHIG